MSARHFLAVEIAAGCAACLLFLASPWCIASFFALAVGAVGAFSVIVKA